MPSTIYLKALGLNTQPSQIEVPDGSLSIAENVNIVRDDVIESRRGFKLYGNAMGSIGDRAKQLIEYKTRIIRHYSDILEYDSNGTGTFLAFAGSFLETQAGLRIKSAELNGNLYITTSDGIRKISAKTPDDFTTAAGFVTLAGGVKAIGLTAYSNYDYGDETSFLVQDSAVAYRVVWGYNDLNSNLILGTPSQRVEVYNPLITLLLQDYMILLGALDNIGANGSMIDDQDYVSTLGLPITADADTLRTNLLSLTTKLDNDILYANTTGTGAPLVISTATITTGVATVNFSSGTATDYFVSGSNINLTGFTPATGTINGAQVVAIVTSNSITFNTTASGAVTVDPAATIYSNEYEILSQPALPDIPPTDQQLVDLQTYISSIINRLDQEPNAVIPTGVSTTFISPLTITTASTVTLNIDIPQNINSNYFFQIYRSQTFTATGTAVLSTDIFPNDELQLVYEAFPTAAELAAGTITVVDVTPDAFLGAFLYTNPTTGEGIAQANDLPPLAKDINVFKNYVFYANTSTRQRKTFNLLGDSNMVADYLAGNIPTVTIATANGFNTYRFILGINESTQITTNGGGTLVAAAAPASYFLINSANNKTRYYVWYKIGLSTDPAISGRTGIEVFALAGDTSTQIAQKTVDALNVHNADFVASNSSNVITVTVNDPGYTDHTTAGTSGFSMSVLASGQGQRVAREIDAFTTVADIAGSLAGKYFTVNTTYNMKPYYIWFKVNAAGTDPAPANKIGLLVNLALNDSAATVATKIAAELNTNHSTEFIATAVGSALTIENYVYGPADNATVGTSGFSLSITSEGALDVLLANLVSPAQSVTATSNSFVQVVNQNRTETAYLYYLSDAQSVPGQFLLEARGLNTGPYYLTSNNSVTGLSFSPDLSPESIITSISTGSPTTMLVTTSTPHGLQNLDTVIISNSNSTPSIDGYQQITYVSPTTFRVNATILIAGTRGSVINTVDAVFSTNEENKNRVYYSKYQQPEAVPILNYLDIGARDKAILRIFPLRDSLFIFKEDGLYRISGEVAPFNLALFDASCIMVASDSIAAVNNIIYCWTRTGISTVTESGVKNASRPIDNILLPLASPNYPNFSTATWGVGYQSDNSYIVYTVTDPTDTQGTQAFRFGTLTNTWTDWITNHTCGINASHNDLLYVGAGDVDYIEIERKTFSRLDFADREYTLNIDDGTYSNGIILFPDVNNFNIVNNIKVNDVLVQEQNVNLYEYNAILKKLDIDPGLNQHNYYSTLKIVPGADLRDALVALAAKLDSDSGILSPIFSSTIGTKTGAITAISAGSPVIITSASHGLIDGRVVLLSSTNSSPTIDNQYSVTVIDANNFSIDESVVNPGTSGTFVTVNSSFADIKTCFNKITELLNADNGPTFHNYKANDTITTLETRIIAINFITKAITVALPLDFVVGPIILFKAIPCEFQYSPITMQDALGLKHLSEATLMFENQNFTLATLSFASDVIPKFKAIDFNGQNPGLFGYNNFGSGLFGGVTQGVPFRTYIPRDHQRCRYLLANYKHAIAREKWSIFGLTISGEIGLSTRAFR